MLSFTTPTPKPKRTDGVPYRAKEQGELGEPEPENIYKEQGLHISCKSECYLSQHQHRNPNGLMGSVQTTYRAKEQGELGNQGGLGQLLNGLQGPETSENSG
jgi:hypothetical protein